MGMLSAEIKMPDTHPDVVKDSIPVLDSTTADGVVGIRQPLSLVSSSARSCSCGRWHLVLSQGGPLDLVGT